MHFMFRKDYAFMHSFVSEKSEGPKADLRNEIYSNSDLSIRIKFA